MTIEEWLGQDNQLGIDIWNKKYKNGDETFDEWLDRVSGGDKNLRRLIVEKKFLFGGRILANRGLQDEHKKITFSNCYVCTSPEDNIESIFECAKKLARTYSYGGGVGVDISKLAPRGAHINNAAKETSGAVSFMELYSLVTALIGQNGRRGALMITLDCHHPDVEEFINIKSDLDKITKANISIRITNDFMNAVINDSDFDLTFTREETGEVIRKTVRAKELFYKIAEMNWRVAEPGMLFWDTITDNNLQALNDDFSYVSTNPCAEEPLPAGGSCLLGSLNLSEFVVYEFTEQAFFSDVDFGRAIKTAVVALNNVLDEGLSLHPLEEQRASVAKWRQIGLGVFGIADMLIKLGIEYGSQEAIDLCDRIGALLATQSIIASGEIAETKGAYDGWDDSVYETPFYTRHVKFTHAPLRNSQILTIAPTGTLSTMLGCSGGIEPIFANSYNRKTQSLNGKDTYYKVYTPIVKKYMEQNGLTSESQLPSYFVTAPQIDYHKRIKMQSIWQSHVDASISSTVNLPNDATIEDVANIYIEAWEHDLKGITVYRSGCEREGVLTTEAAPTVKPVAQLNRGDIIEISDDEIARVRHLQTGCGTLHLTACFDPTSGDLLETYFSKGSQGGCEKNLVGLSRMISIAARSGVPVHVIVDQLQSVGLCSAYTVRAAKLGDTSKGTSCCTAIGNALLSMWKQVQDELFDSEDDDEFTCSQPTGVKCPECGEILRFEGGCNSCPSCGYSKCN